MEYQLRTAPGLNRQDITVAVLRWLRNAPLPGSASAAGWQAGQSIGNVGGHPSHSYQPPAPPASPTGAPRPHPHPVGGPSPRPAYRVVSPAHNAFSTHQMKTAGEISIGPHVFIKQLSQTGQQQYHVFVLDDRTLLLVQQAGFHHRWVHVGHGWHQPFAQALPPMPTAAAVDATGGSLFQPVSWFGRNDDPAVSRLDRWQKLLWAAGEGVRQFGPQALEVIKEMLTWEGALTLLAITAVLAIPYVGEVVLVGLMGQALYDLLANVMSLFKQYYQTAVSARTQADSEQAGKYFAQALVKGLLDVLAVFAGTAALSRLRALRAAGKLTLRAWVELIVEQAKQLWGRLRSGTKRLNDWFKGKQESAPLQADSPPANMTNAQKGVYGEHVSDVYMHNQGYQKLNDGGALTPATGGARGTGIDGVWRNPSPPPEYIITEAKYGSSKLGDTADGKQMSDDWLMGGNRLERAVGDTEAAKIRRAMRRGEVRKEIHRIDQNGNITVKELDEDGNIIN